MTQPGNVPDVADLRRLAVWYDEIALDYEVALRRTTGVRLSDLDRIDLERLRNQARAKAERFRARIAAKRRAGRRPQ